MTKKNYVEAISDFSRYYSKSPHKLGEENIKTLDVVAMKAMG
jgi:hypothetical protein